MTSRSLSRQAGLLLIGGFGAVLAVLTLAHLWIVSDLRHTLIELMILGGLTAAYWAVVYRTWRDDIPADLLPGVVRWGFGGAIGLLVVVVPSVSYVGLPPTGHDAVFSYQIGLSVGGLGGLLAGYHEARAVAEARESAQTERERRRLEELNQLLRHDVLNNLTVIEGNLDLALADVDDPAVADHIETARTQTREATEHIQNVRVLVQSARGAPELGPVDLSETLAGELAQLRDSYPAADITADVPADIRVRADDLLGSIFENLVRNAVEHNDGETPHVSVSARRSGDTVAVRVADDGPGVPETVAQSLYETPERGDHGLGLHLVETLVDRYGGSIRLAANDADGATFVVELPRA